MKNDFPIRYKTLCCNSIMEFTYNGQMIYCECWNDEPGDKNPGIAVDIGDGYYIRVLGNTFTNVVPLDDSAEEIGQFSDYVGDK